MNETPELHRPVRIDELPPKGLKIDLKPSQNELQAIADRLGIVAVNQLEADLRLQPEMGRQISLTGSIRVEIVQNCVITGEPLTVPLEFDVYRTFAEDADPFDGLNNSEDDILDDPDFEEPDPIIDGKIDVGEQAIEELALNIPPYPRAPGAVFEPITTDPAPDEKRPNPFAALQSLKNKMESKD